MIRIPNQNQENHEKLIIPRPNQENHKKKMFHARLKKLLKFVEFHVIFINNNENLIIPC